MPEPRPAFLDRAAFETWAEQQSVLFRERYSLGETDAWTEQQLGQALSDHGLPPLDQLPAEPRGMLAQDFPGPVAPGEERSWQRVNAMHLIGHCIVHEGQRCPGCEDW